MHSLATLKYKQGYFPPLFSSLMIAKEMQLRVSVRKEVNDRVQMPQYSSGHTCNYRSYMRGFHFLLRCSCSTLLKCVGWRRRLYRVRTHLVRIIFSKYLRKQQREGKDSVYFHLCTYKFVFVVALQTTSDQCLIIR